MAKLDALKEKISQAQSSVSEKLDKIALFKKWKEQRAQKTLGPRDHSLGEIYHLGGTSTRLQVILIYVFAFAAVFFTVQSGRKIFARLGKSVENEKLKAEYSHGLEEMAQRVVEKANMVSMGKFTANVYRDGQPGNLLAVDVWLRVNDPVAAEFAEKNDALISDGIVSAFNDAYQAKIDPLDEAGKEAMKNRIVEAVNKLLPRGKVEEVFFQNMIAQ